MTPAFAKISVVAVNVLPDGIRTETLAFAVTLGVAGATAVGAALAFGVTCGCSTLPSVAVDGFFGATALSELSGTVGDTTGVGEAAAAGAEGLTFSLLSTVDPSVSVISSLLSFSASPRQILQIHR